MHNKSVVSAIGIFCSIGVWFMWNLIFSAVYKKTVIYYVKDGFLRRFGKTALWWLVLILVVSACILLELGIKSLKSAYWTSDVSVSDSRLNMAANHSIRWTCSKCMNKTWSSENNSRRHPQ